MPKTLPRMIAVAALGLTLPFVALADLSQTTTLAAGQSLNLDTGLTTGTSDLQWGGSALTPQGSAKAVILVGFTGATLFANNVTQTLLAVTLPVAGSSAAIPSSSLPAGTIIGVMTNAGHPAKLLVIAITGSSITLQFVTYGATSGPTITGVFNNSSNIPAGFPNSGISQGALFKVVGSALADDGDAALHDSQASGGLPTLLSNAKITITVNGTTVTVALYYATPTQIDGVMPSNMPTGSGTLTVTHNGTASAAFTILVVVAAPGITTYNNGTAVAQDFNRPTDPYGGLVTVLKSAPPGGIMTIWGSGFGATSDSDTAYTTSPHAVTVSYTVYIGGVQVTNLGYAGRSVYPGVHVFVLTIPQNVPTGCYVPIVAVAVINGVSTVSNTSTLPIHAGGGECSDPQLGVSGSQITTLTGQSTVKSGTVIVTQSTGPGAGGATVTSNTAGAFFQQVTGSSYGGGGGIASLGGCVVTQNGGSGSGGGGGTAIGLDAGAITVTVPGGAPVTMTAVPAVPGTYFANLSPIVPGAFVFNGAGGAGVGKFTATVTFSSPLLAWTNQSAAASVTRGQGLLISWTGGFGTYVIIIGSSSGAGGVSGSYLCVAPVSAGSFTVPSYILLALPAGTGATLIQNSTNFSQFSASGLDFGTAIGAESFQVSTTYN